MCRWPSKPNPVTSVAADTPTSTIASQAAAFSDVIVPTARNMDFDFHKNVPPSELKIDLSPAATVTRTPKGLVLSLKITNASAHDIQTSWLPSVRWLGELRTHVNRYRSVVREHLLAIDAKVRSLKFHLTP